MAKFELDISINGAKIGDEIEAINQSVRKSRSELATLKKELQASWDMDKFARAQELAGRAVEDTKQKVELLKAAMKKIEDEGMPAERAADYERIKRELTYAESAARKAAESLKELANIRVDSLTKSIEKASASLDKVQSKAKYASGAVAAGLGLAAKAAMDFEATMSSLQAILGATSEEMEILKKAAQDTALNTTFSADEIAASFKYMAVAGADSDRMLDSLSGIIGLAQGSGLNLAQTAEIVADSLEAFGLAAQDTDHFANVLAATTNVANVEVGQLGETLKYVAPVAGTFGFTVDDMAVSIALMANSGIKASQAGTTLRAALDNLNTGSAEAKATMERLGIAITNSDGSMKSLQEIIENLQDGFAGMSESEQAAAASAIFGKSAYSGMLTIIRATEQQMSDAAEAIYGADEAFGGMGAAAGMAATTTDNAQSALKMAKNAITGAAIELGSALLPAIQAVAGNVKELAKWFSSLDDGTKRLVATLGVATALFSPMLKLFSWLVPAIASLIVKRMAHKVAIDAETASQTALNVAQSASPVGALTMGLSLLLSAATAVGVGMALTAEKTRDMVREFEDAKKSIESKVNASEAELIIVEKLLPKYEHLNEKITRTKREQDELNEVVKQINAIMPDAIGIIDEETGAYDKSTAAIRENIKAKREEIQLAAKKELLQEAVKKYTELETETKSIYGTDESKTTEEQLKDLMLGGKRPLLPGVTGNGGIIQQQQKNDIANRKKQLEELNELIKEYSDGEIDMMKKEIVGLGSPFKKSSTSEDGNGGKTGGAEEPSFTAQAYLDELEYKHARGLISEAAYVAELIKIRDAHGKDDIEAWRKRDVQIYQLQQKLTADQKKELEQRQKDADDAKKKADEEAEKARQEEEKARQNAIKQELADIKWGYNNRETSLKDYIAALIAYRDKYLQDDIEAWRAQTLEIARLQEELAKQYRDAVQERYDSSMKMARHLYDMGDYSDADYLAEMRTYRDAYLEENTDAWRKATLEIYRMEQQIAEAEKKELQERAENFRRFADEVSQIAAKEAEARIKAIDDEIAARDRLMESERAQKMLEQAQAKLLYETDEENRRELQKQIERLKQEQQDRDIRRLAEENKELIRQEMESAKAAMEAASESYQKSIGATTTNNSYYNSQSQSFSFGGQTFVAQGLTPAQLEESVRRVFERLIRNV